MDCKRRHDHVVLSGMERTHNDVVFIWSYSNPSYSERYSKKRNSSKTKREYGIAKNAVFMFIWKQRSNIRSLKSFRSSRGRKIIQKNIKREKKRKEKAQCHAQASSNPFCFFPSKKHFFSWVVAGCSNESWNISFRIKKTEKEIQKGIWKMPFHPYSFWARLQWPMISLP